MELVTDGLRFPEGPVAMPDGSVVLVEIAAGCVTRVLPDGSQQVIAELGGGPNGAAIGPDGKLYVCNNGGFNYVETRRSADPAWRSRTTIRADASSGWIWKPVRSRRSTRSGDFGCTLRGPE